MPMRPPHPAPGALLLHPVALAAIAVLVLNDHVLKGTAPAWLTGKLSDCAGLIFFPLLLHAIWQYLRLLCRREPGRSLAPLAVCCAATVIVFSLVQLWIPAMEAVQLAWGAAQWPLVAARAAISGAPTPPVSPVMLTADPSDILTTPAALISLVIGAQRLR